MKEKTQRPLSDNQAGGIDYKTKVTIINEKIKTHYKMAGVHLIVGMMWVIVFQSVSFAIFFIMSLVNCRKAMILEQERFEIT